MLNKFNYMRIANPIFDTVFKFLLEDETIAKGLLSALLNIEIVQISLKPTEVSYRKFLDSFDNVSEQQKTSIMETLGSMHYDFKAVIKTPEGNFKTVLIEIQKSKVVSQVGRFRRYLAENYRKRETVLDTEGKEHKEFLEIICIYFLNKDFEDLKPAILKIDHKFIDSETEKTIELEGCNEFVRLLNHKSIFIQIPKLSGEKNSHLKQLLDIFDQQKKSKDDDKILEYEQTAEVSELKKLILERLKKVLADEDLLRDMEIEEDLEIEITELLHKKEKVILTKEKELEEKDKTIEENQKTIANAILHFHKTGLSNIEIAAILNVEIGFVEKMIGERC